MQDARRRSIQVDLSQYDEITKYCTVTGASRANVGREAIALFLRNVAPKRLTAFRKEAQPVRKPIAAVQEITHA